MPRRKPIQAGDAVYVFLAGRYRRARVLMHMRGRGTCRLQLAGGQRLTVDAREAKADAVVKQEVQQIYRALEQALGRPPTAAELAVYCGVGAMDWLRNGRRRGVQR